MTNGCVVQVFEDADCATHREVRRRIMKRYFSLETRKMRKSTTILKKQSELSDKNVRDVFIDIRPSGQPKTIAASAETGKLDTL